MSLKTLLFPFALQILAATGILSAKFVASSQLEPATRSIWERQDASVHNVTSSTACATLTASSNSSQQTVGFLYDGKIGSYDCVYTPQAAFPLDTTVPGTACIAAQPPVFPYNPISIRATDDSIRAVLLPYASTLSELWVKDRWGGWRDVILGYDNKTNYGTDPIHPNFGPIVGRYANRIKNGTFQVDGVTYHVPKNENGFDTLHGGTIGYDRSTYRIESWSSNEVVLSHDDPDGFQGFPGAVKTFTRYTLKPNAVWETELNATTTQKTPIMLSSHVYWNLEAFNESQSILDHVLHLPYADKYVKTDSILVPTGPLPLVDHTPYDFRTPVSFSKHFNQTNGICGFNCTGWDSCFVMSDPPSSNLEKGSKPVLEMYSPKSGIKLSVHSDQAAIQVYTCSGIDSPTKGAIPRKRSHGGQTGANIGKEVYENYSCVVLEMEDYIDGINHPEWGRHQIYGPNQPYHWKSTYRFSNVDEEGQALVW